MKAHLFVVVSDPEELESTPYVVSLYDEAIQKGEEIDKTIRVNVVGNYAQGKTSLVRRLTGQSLEGVDSTNGVEVNRCKLISSTERQCISLVNEKPDMDIYFIERVAQVARSTENKRSCVTEDLKDDQSIAVKHPMKRKMSQERDHFEKKRRLSPEKDDFDEVELISNKEEGNISKSGTSTLAESESSRKNLC